MDEIEFDVKMSAGALYDFYLYTTYTSLTGMLGTLVGILLLVNYASHKELAYLIFGLIVLFYLPVTLYISAKKNVLLVDSFKKTLHYRLDEKGMEVSQDDTTQTLEWDGVVKVCATASNIFVFTTKKTATIFPRKELGEKTTAIITLLSKYVEPKKMKIRF